MCEVRQVFVSGRLVGVTSWTTGFTPHKTPSFVARTEDEVMAKAMYLERHGQTEIALELIEAFTATNISMMRAIARIIEMSRIH